MKCRQQERATHIGGASGLHQRGKTGEASLRVALLRLGGIYRPRYQVTPAVSER